MTDRKRVAVVVSHPIQYFVPLYRALAREPTLDIRVLFASRIGLDNTFDRAMNIHVAWAMDLLGGYSHEFLPEAGTIEQTGFFEVENPSVGVALARYRPDAVIIHGYAMLTMLRALAWCRLRGIPAIMASDSSTDSSGPGIRRLVKKVALPVLLRQFGAMLTMGDRSEAHLARYAYPRARMFRTPIMIDEVFWTARHNRAESRVRDRAALGLGPDDFILLFVGKLYAGKCVFDILDAMCRLKRLRPKDAPPTLFIAGDGAQRRDLEAFAAARDLPVRFMGFVNVDKLPDIYGLADVLIHSAELEQYGTVLIEAAVVGLPLILSDRIGAIGVTSIARPDENAIIYPCHDAGALADAIITLRDGSGLRQRMSAASARFALDHAGPMSMSGVLAALATSGHP